MRSLIAFILIFLSFNIYADKISDKGLFCKLDKNDSNNYLFEAFLFSDSTFVSLYLDISNTKVDIKRSIPEKYYLTKKYIILRGLNIDKKKLRYKTMGGTFYCQMLSKNLLLQNVRELQEEKKKKMFN